MLARWAHNPKLRGSKPRAATAHCCTAEHKVCCPHTDIKRAESKALNLVEFATNGRVLCAQSFVMAKPDTWGLRANLQWPRFSDFLTQRSGAEVSVLGS